MAEQLPKQYRFDPVAGAIASVNQAHARIVALAQLLEARGLISHADAMLVLAPAEAGPLCAPVSHAGRPVDDHTRPCTTEPQDGARDRSEAHARLSVPGSTTPTPHTGEGAPGAACPRSCARNSEDSGVSRG